MSTTILRALCVALLGICAACASGDSGGSEPLTYREAVQRIGRPPTRSAMAPGGGLVAMWDTKLRGGGTRRLIMTFDSHRRLENSRTETLPARSR